MLKLIQRFAASPFSGYALIALLIGAVVAGYWFWSELKEFGSLQAKSEAQAVTIESQRQTLDELSSLMDAKDGALERQSGRVKRLERNTRIQQLAVMEAKKHADKVTRECMALHLADGLQFGPSRQDGDSEDKARSNVDG